MPDTNDHAKPELTLIRGGRSRDREFGLLPTAEKVTRLRRAAPKERLELLIGDPQGRELARALKPEELYLTFREIGAVDAQEIVELASPEQREFFLDMELWERSSFSRAKALEWLGYLLEAGEAVLVEQLPYLDMELLLAILIGEITVGGGTGELATDEERTFPWDHSFDNNYFIHFRQKDSSRLVAGLLDIVYRHDQELYRSLMEGVKNEIETEMVEEALHLRAGRLAENGFPSREEAVMIYARVDPASFRPVMEKKFPSRPGHGSLPADFRDDSLLARAFRRLDSEAVGGELAYLVNNALIAEETPFADSEAIAAVMARVSGWLAIALEYLAGDDEEQAALLLDRESLTRLFQLGHAVVQGLKKKAGAVVGGDYATTRALAGLKAERPRFYRGFDPDGIDGYREFAGLADVRKVEEFLDLMKREG